MSEPPHAVTAPPKRQKMQIARVSGEDMGLGDNVGPRRTLHFAPPDD
jgi:hypothetical protein